MPSEVRYRGNASSTYNDTWLDEDNASTQYRAAQTLLWGRQGTSGETAQEIETFDFSAPVDLSQDSLWTKLDGAFGSLVSASAGAGLTVASGDLLDASYSYGHGLTITATAVSVTFIADAVGVPDRIYAALNLADRDNYHGVAAINGTGGDLRKVVSGTITSLGTFSTVPGDVVRLDRLGNALRVYVNGSEVLAANADTGLTSTNVGLVKAGGPGGTTELSQFRVSEVAAVEGRAHPFIEWDLFDDTPVNGTAIAAGAVVQSATLKITLARTVPSLEVWPIRSGRYAGDDAPEWSGIYPNWNKSSSTALTSDAAGNFWVGATENVSSTAFAVIQPGSVPKPITVAITTLVQDAIDNNDGVLQLVFSLPAGDTSQNVEIYPYDALGPSAFYPELEVRYEASTSVNRLVLPRRGIRAMVGGRLV